MEERLAHLEREFARALAAGDTAAAGQALRRADWVREPADQARVALMSGRLARAAGDPAGAAAGLARAVERARAAGRHDLVASGWLVELADARLAAGDAAGSEQALAEAGDLARRIATPDAGRVRFRAALVRARGQVARGDHAGAADTLGRAAEDLRDADPRLAAEALAGQAAALRRAGRGDAAREAGERARGALGPPGQRPVVETAAPVPPGPAPPVDETALAAALADLDALVGLAAVKEEVRRLVAFARVQRRRRDAGHRVPAISHHLLFTGPPGTGKTTVARLLGRLYRAVGVLRSGHLVEVDRSGLVAGFIGQTAPRVNEVCDRALDGVLFIDEAYALVRDGSPQDFGAEALAALLKRMEDDRERLLVVMAGYDGPMQDMLDTNPGLASRIPNRIAFSPYTAAELAEILRRMAAADDYRLGAGAEPALTRICEALAARGHEPDFGNARAVRNLYEEALMRHAERVADAPGDELSVLLAGDLERAAGGG